MAGTNKKTQTKAAARKPRKPREPVEYKDNADRFKQLAKKRVSKALKQIHLIGNLSGSGYEYTDEQVAKIREALTDAVDSAMKRFVKGPKVGTDFEV